MYKIKGASKCIKFRCSEQLVKRFSYKVNVLGTMWNSVQKEKIHCLTFPPVLGEKDTLDTLGVKCPVAVKMEPDVQIPDCIDKHCCSACDTLYSECPLQKHQPGTN